MHKHEMRFICTQAGASQKLQKLYFSTLTLKALMKYISFYACKKGQSAYQKASILIKPIGNIKNTDEPIY